MKLLCKLHLDKALLLLLGIFFTTACASDNKTQSTSAPATATAAPVASDKGVGPVQTVSLDASIDQALATEGRTIFESKCSACHKQTERYVGPAIAGVTDRRKPEWIMNMIINPQEMLSKDPIALELLGEYMTQMPNQNVDEKDARAILEYFRSLDKN
jgi:mono/diheme cytochrome c family protein